MADNGELRRDEAKRLYTDERLPEREVAHRMGVSRARVQELLRQAGVRKRRRGAPRKRRRRPRS